jgi:cystathionine gamma-synthase
MQICPPALDALPAEPPDLATPCSSSQRQQRGHGPKLRRMQPETKLARAQLPPLDRATIHAYENATPGPVFYQRVAHPVGLEAEHALGELEGGEVLLFPSGSAATTALALALLEPGATVAIAEGGYWGTVALLRGELSRWGLNVTMFDQTRLPPDADLVWLEPCANPMLTFPDLDGVIAAAHRAGGRVVVDNTVLSPLLLRPLEHGADFVLHSATKILAGHHDALLGAVASARPEDAARLAAFRTASGLVAAPDPVWLMLRGLKTLAVRVKTQSATALELAGRLAAHSAVIRVRYPGLGDPVARRYVEAFGPLLSFDVADGERAGRVERSLRVIENATSLGGVASTLEARARWEGDRVPPGLLRLSVGLEDGDDLWADLQSALDTVAP